jgi:hypothetical protein
MKAENLKHPFVLYAIVTIFLRLYIYLKIRPKKEKILLITSFTGWNGRRERPALCPDKMAGGGV